jgi:hypothetical protein
MIEGEGSACWRRWGKQKLVWVLGRGGRGVAYRAYTCQHGGSSGGGRGVQAARGSGIPCEHALRSDGRAILHARGCWHDAHSASSRKSLPLWKRCMHAPQPTAASRIASPPPPGAPLAVLQGLRCVQEATRGGREDAASLAARMRGRHAAEPTPPFLHGVFHSWGPQSACASSDPQHVPLNSAGPCEGSWPQGEGSQHHPRPARVGRPR